MEVNVEEGTIVADKYRVERVIGRGGMGLVVAAVHIQLGQRVALKFLSVPKPDLSDAGERFLREARLAVRIRSEHVARVMDAATTPSGAPYIVMEYLEGEDLSRLCQRGPLAVPFAVDYLLHACEAVAEAHRLGIVHRDLKPANLFLTRRPNGSHLVKVLDFGISKVMAGSETSNASVTATGVLVGSPLYMSPEQIRDSRNVDSRADIWSLGAILHELLSGKPPYHAETLPGLLAKIVADPPEPLSQALPGVDPTLDRIVSKCLQKGLSERYSSVGELAAALAPFASAEGAALAKHITATPSGPDHGRGDPRALRGNTARPWGSTSWGASNASWIASQAGKARVSPRRWALPVAAATCGMLAAGWIAWGGSLSARSSANVSAAAKPDVFGLASTTPSDAPRSGVRPRAASADRINPSAQRSLPMADPLPSARLAVSPTVALIQAPAAQIRSRGVANDQLVPSSSTQSGAQPAGGAVRGDSDGSTQKPTTTRRPSTTTRGNRRKNSPSATKRTAQPTRSVDSPSRRKARAITPQRQPTPDGPQLRDPRKPADDLELFGDTK